MRSYWLLVMCCLFSVILAAQQSIESIFRNSNNYEEIVAQAEQYFQKKHPSISLNKLAEGEGRDGKYVKFMRWKQFWKDRLNSDGTLGDITAHRLTQAKRNTHLEKNSNPYTNIAWSNISYNDYITSQIGLGRTTSIAFHPTDPDIFYVGAAIGGVWRTTNGGQSYTAVGDNLPFMAVSSLVVAQNNPNTIYAAISDHVWYGPQGIGIYKSTNAGATWSPTALSFDFEDDIRIYWMIADENNPNRMFVATADGLYRTDDGFSTVIKLNSYNCFDVKIKPGDSNTIYLGTNYGQFYKSTNGGFTFTLVNSFLPTSVYIALTPVNPDKVYLRNGTTLHKSFDSGATFPQSSGMIEGNEMIVFAPNSEDILLTGNVETHRTNNSGSFFYTTSDWLGNGLPQVHVDQRNIFTNPLQSDYAYYCNDGGVYRYSISTGAFENLSDGLMITQFYDIAVAQTDVDVISAGSQDNGNVYRNSFGVWDDYAPTGDGMIQAVDPTNADLRYWEYQNGSLYRWNGSYSWNISPPGKGGTGAWETPFRLDPNNPSRIIAGYNSVYESLNRGTSWSTISEVLDGGNIEHIAIATTNSNRVYAVRGATLYVKDVANYVWTPRSMPARISDIEVAPDDMNTIYVSVPGFSDGTKVLKSTDAGATWENISGTLPNISIGAIEIYKDKSGGLFIGTDAGVYYRDDELSDWLEYGQLPHTRVEDIEIQYSAQLVRAATHGRGVLEAPISLVACHALSSDSDNDGICDPADFCPGFDDTLIGTACDDNDPYSTGESYTSNCACEGGASNLSYCNAQGISTTGADWIDRVLLNTIDYSSLQTNYSDFRSQYTYLERGGTYNLKVSLNYAFDQDVMYTWIDWDRSGTFEESERITMSDFDIFNDSQATFTVPNTAQLGATTMRVRNIYATTPTPDPCTNYLGEVEDYTIFVTCPSTEPNCTDALLISPKLFLFGAYAGSSNMQTTLNDANLIDLQQPYTDVYTGTESVSIIPADVVDWVLVELRSTASTVVARRAAFLKRDGSVVDLDGVSPVAFKDIASGNYFVAIRHRNHLGVMTDSAIPLN